MRVLARWTWCAFKFGKGRADADKSQRDADAAVEIPGLGKFRPGKGQQFMDTAPRTDIRLFLTNLSLEEATEEGAGVKTPSPARRSACSTTRPRAKSYACTVVRTPVCRGGRRRRGVWNSKPSQSSRRRPDRWCVRTSPSSCLRKNYLLSAFLSGRCPEFADHAAGCAHRR